MFKYDWSNFNVRMGLIFMVGVFVVFNLMGEFDFDVMAAGISAMLAWVTIILVPARRWGQHVIGLVVYLVAGAALTWLAYKLAAYEGVLLGSMAVITFAGYMVLLRGPHPYIVAWCLVYWYLLVPVFLSGKELGPVVLAHVVGAGVVIGLNLLKPVWSRATRDAISEAESTAKPAQDSPSVGFVVRYATVVSISIVVGLAAGMRWLIHDPTLVANATLNMISPSLKQTWVAGVERLVFGTLGVLGGFYLGWYFTGPWIGYLVTAVCAFLALGLLYINMGLTIGVLFFMIAYSWGGMRSDLAHEIGNEKLIAEFAGVAIAIAAIAVLAWLEQRKASSADS